MKKRQLTCRDHGGRGIDAMNCPECAKELDEELAASDQPSVPPELDRIADVVLAYKPKPKTKAAKRRVRRDKREAKSQKSESSI
jgi:hypothetical protein